MLAAWLLRGGVGRWDSYRSHFPVGALMFLVAFLLIACGCACCRR